MVLSTWKVVLGGVAVMAGVAEAFSPTGLAPHSRLGLRGAPGAAIGRRMGVQAVGPVMDLDWYKVNPPHSCSAPSCPQPTRVHIRARV